MRIALFSMNVIYWLSGFAMLVLGGTTVILAYYNWNNELQSKLISITVIGISTAFVTILLSLKETGESVVFYTSLVMDAEDRLPVRPEGDTITHLGKRLFDIALLTRPKVLTDDQRIALRSAANTPMESQYYCEALCNLLVLDVLGQQTQTFSAFSFGSTQSSRYITETRKEVSISAENTVSIYESDILGHLPRPWYMKQDAAHDRIYNFPKDLSISYNRAGRKPSIKIQPHTIVLDRPRYLRCVISIEPTLKSNASLPNGFYSARANDHYFAVVFRVTISWQNKRFSSAGSTSREMIEWIRSVTANIVHRWSDDFNDEKGL